MRSPIPSSQKFLKIRDIATNNKHKCVNHLEKPDTISLNDKDMIEIIKEFLSGFKGLTKDSSIELSDKTNGNYSSNKKRFIIGGYITKFVIDRIKLGNIDNFLKDVSSELTKTYKDSGLSHTNLNYIRKFYKKYRNQPDLSEKAFEFSWSQNIALLKDKINDDERNYYLNRAIADDWSVKEIERQIKDDSFDNFLNEIEQNNYQFNIKALRIKNYKSLENIKISEPSKLLVFAGANASGKSNIFEAIEFLMHAAMTTGTIAFDIFGGVKNIVNYKASKQNVDYIFTLVDQDDKEEQRKNRGYRPPDCPIVVVNEIQNFRGNRNYIFGENPFVIMTREMESWFLADANLNLIYEGGPEEILNPSYIVGEQLGTSSHVNIANKLKDRFSLVRASENSRSPKRFLDKLKEIANDN